jgi:hypothetical protein
MILDAWGIFHRLATVRREECFRWVCRILDHLDKRAMSKLREINFYNWVFFH